MTFRHFINISHRKIQLFAYSRFLALACAAWFASSRSVWRKSTKSVARPLRFWTENGAATTWRLSARYRGHYSNWKIIILREFSEGFRESPSKSFSCAHWCVHLRFVTARSARWHAACVYSSLSRIIIYNIMLATLQRGVTHTDIVFSSPLLLL